MALLSQLLDSNDKIKRVVSETAEFFSIFYGPWFLKSAVPQRGPGNECQIIELMKGYQELKQGVAQAVLHAMQGLACYLTLSFVVMALTDDAIPVTKRQHIASALLEAPFPESFTFGRPKFPDQYVKYEILRLKFRVGKS